MTDDLVQDGWQPDADKPTTPTEPTPLPNNTGSEIKTDPTITPVTTDSPALVTPNKKAPFKDRLETARLAMEGPERTVKREEDETEKRVEDEKEKLEKDLALIGHHKEKLEINWVVLDTKQSEFKTLLAPLKQEEEAIELEEDQLEGEEHTTSDIAARQEIEKKRWTTQDKRKDLEKRKWEIENKILVIEADLKKNTEQYQKFLDEEEIINKKIETLEYEVQVAKEKVRLEEERQHAEEEARLIEEEKQRREEEKKQAEEIEKKQREAVLAQKKAEEEARLKAEIEKKKAEDEKRKIEEQTRLQRIEAEQKERAQQEMKRQGEARRKEEEERKQQAETATAAATPIISNDPTIEPTSASPVIDAETRQRAELLEKARAAAVANTIDTVDLTSTTQSGEEIVKPEGEISAPERGVIGDDDVPSALPNETSNLPHLRTFKDDVENGDYGLTPEQIKEAKKKFPWLK